MREWALEQGSPSNRLCGNLWLFLAAKEAGSGGGTCVCLELLSDSDVAPNYAESELAMMPRLLSGSSSHV